MSDPNSNLIVRCQANVRTCEKISKDEYSLTLRSMAWGSIDDVQYLMKARYTKALQQNTEHYFEGKLYFEHEESMTEDHCYHIATSVPLPFPFPYDGPGLDCKTVEFDVTATLDTIYMTDVDDRNVGTVRMWFSFQTIEEPSNKVIKQKIRVLMDKEGRKNFMLKPGQRYDISGKGVYASDEYIHTWKGSRFHRVF